MKNDNPIKLYIPKEKIKSELEHHKTIYIKLSFY